MIPKAPVRTLIALSGILTRYPMAKSKYSKKVIQEVLDHVAQGKSLRELYQLDKSKYPCPSLVCKWAVNKEDFREQYHKAKWEAVYKAQDELNYLKDNPPKINVDTEDVRILGQLTTQWRQKISTLEKYINHFASIYDSKMQKKEKIEQTVDTSGPQIVVMNYSDKSQDTGIDVPNSDDYTYNPATVDSEEPH